MRLAAVIPGKGEDSVKAGLAAAIMPECVRIALPILNHPVGVGAAYRDGFKQALELNATHVLMYDADGDMDDEDIPALAAAAERGADLVVGSRWAEGGGFVGYEPRKLIVNAAANLLLAAALRTRISDLTYGFKILSRRVLEAIDWRSDGHGIYCETTVRPIARGFSAVEVPTVWHGRRQGVATPDWRGLLRSYGLVAAAAIVERAAQ